MKRMSSAISWLAMRQAPARRSRSLSGNGDSNGRERSAKAAWFAVFKATVSQKEKIVLYVRNAVKRNSYKLNDFPVLRNPQKILQPDISPRGDEVPGSTLVAKNPLPQPREQCFNPRIHR